MQSKYELEQWYEKKDPWGYEKNPDDKFRKDLILTAVKGKYERALDIGAGEGWITKDLPAKEIHAIELSDEASKRFPDTITRIFEPKGTYDLIIACGVLYEQYDWKQMLKWIEESATDTVLTCNILSWEMGLPNLPDFNMVYETTFPYRDYKEHLCLYRYHPPQN